MKEKKRKKKEGKHLQFGCDESATCMVDRDAILMLELSSKTSLCRHAALGLSLPFLIQGSLLFAKHHHSQDSVDTSQCNFSAMNLYIVLINVRKSLVSAISTETSPHDHFGHSGTI